MLAFTGTQQAGVLGHEGYRCEDAQTSGRPHALHATVLLWREKERSKENFSSFRKHIVSAACFESRPDYSITESSAAIMWQTFAVLKSEDLCRLQIKQNLIFILEHRYLP